MTPQGLFISLYNSNRLDREIISELDNIDLLFSRNTPLKMDNGFYLKEVISGEKPSPEVLVEICKSNIEDWQYYRNTKEIFFMFKGVYYRNKLICFKSNMLN